MNAVFKFGLASALALTAAAPAAAQYYQPTPQYQQDLYRYQQQQSDYQARQAAYESRRQSYEAARRDYERRRADWEAARAAYDARWGYGAYARVYGAAPVWDEAYWNNYYPGATASVNPYYGGRYTAPSTGYYGSNGYNAPYAGYYGSNSAYTAPVRISCDGNNSVTASVLGALANQVLGSTLGTSTSPQGAVLGALTRGLGRTPTRFKCDASGPYFTRAETIPYRESAYMSSYDAEQYRYYTRLGCRLAAAPVDTYGQEVRYVRVCPDASGRYRITG